MDLKIVLEAFNHSVTLFILFPAILMLGFYLTFKLKFVQITQLKTSFSLLTKKGLENEGNISRFEALSAVLAGNFGTGNISGMAVALATGGPGALVWMWVMAFFGSAIQYASCLLGVSYRSKTQEEYVGGPMYYLRDGLGLNKIALSFALFTIFGAITVGNFAQINSVILPLEKIGFNPFYCSLGIAALVGCVILGGIQRIASFASFIVPIKAILYLGTAFVIIALNYQGVVPAFKLMFNYAFDFSSLAGGILGFGMLKALTTGFGRGLFATDAGTGIVPILQASARSTNPVMDGIATLAAPFMVMIVCTATGLVLILTGVWQNAELRSTNMVTQAFAQGLNSPIGGYVVIAALVLFAYTTILAWAYCGEKALGFLTSQEKARYFRFIYVALIPVGSLIHVDLIWILADLAITFMLIANLVGIAGLSGEVIKATDAFRKEVDLQSKNALS
jgi:alanine or glycine:cation symporter, AGCS family